MRFALSAEQRQFAASLRDLLTAADVPALGRQWAAGEPAAGRKLWEQLAELGVTGLLVPERFDGLGADPLDVVVAFEELGYFAVPGPLVESVAAVPVLLTALDDGTAGSPAARWLPGLAAGDRLATVQLPPGVPAALDADLADPALLVDGTGLHLGKPRPALSSVDGSRRMFALGTESAPIAVGDAVAEAAATAFDHGVLACAAQLLGLGRGLLDLTTGYAGQRQQFGRAIGGFQAVKHHLADVLVGLELARPLLHGAALALAAGADTAARDVSAAKVACADAAYRAARIGLQVHGAIGYTQEYDLVLALTKVRALRTAWGTAADHRARIADALRGRGTTARSVPIGDPGSAEPPRTGDSGADRGEVRCD